MEERKLLEGQETCVDSSQHKLIFFNMQQKSGVSLVHGDSWLGSLENFHSDFCDILCSASLSNTCITFS